MTTLWVVAASRGPGMGLCPLTAGVLLAIAVAALHIRWTHRDKHLLHNWASRNGFELQTVEPRFSRCGRFTLRRSWAQRVYYVTVRDAGGHVRKGYVRLGGLFGEGEWVSEDWDGNQPPTQDTPNRR
jgi:hypothetical protein